MKTLWFSMDITYFSMWLFLNSSENYCLQTVDEMPFWHFFSIAIENEREEFKKRC